MVVRLAEVEIQEEAGNLEVVSTHGVSYQAEVEGTDPQLQLVVVVVAQLSSSFRSAEQDQAVEMDPFLEA